MDDAKKDINIYVNSPGGSAVQSHLIFRRIPARMFAVLGPLEVLQDGEPVPIPAGRARVLLATLLLRPNQFVSVDELFRIATMNDLEPSDAEPSMQNWVSRRVQCPGETTPADEPS